MAATDLAAFPSSDLAEYEKQGLKSLKGPKSVEGQAASGSNPSMSKTVEGDDHAGRFDKGGWKKKILP